MPDRYAPRQCPANCLIRDDRMGGFVDRCDLPEGHSGEHRGAMDACEPKALRSWVGTYDDRYEEANDDDA